MQAPAECSFVLKALRSRPRSLSLDNAGLTALPPAMQQLDFLESLSAKNNQLQTLPPEIAKLKRVRLKASTFICTN